MDIDTAFVQNCTNDYARPIFFHKMHGLGNDFVIINAQEQIDPQLTLSPAQIRWMSDRHRGVGCDQFIILRPPLGDSSQTKGLFGPGESISTMMEIYNQDGSRAETCGNATRCVAFMQLQKENQKRVILSTAAGDLEAWHAQDDVRSFFANQTQPIISVNMGAPCFDWQKIPLAEPVNDILALPISVEGLSPPAAVAFGNPHLVFFVNVKDGAVQQDQGQEQLACHELGPQLEHHPLFPAKTNVSFVTILSPRRCRVVVWERGAGLTQACGSAACAVMATGCRAGLLQNRAEIILPGGTLLMDIVPGGPPDRDAEQTASDKSDCKSNSQQIIMSGPVADSFCGVADLARMG